MDCVGYLVHPFENIGLVCMIVQDSMPKHGRCEYNERDAFCSREECENTSMWDKGLRGYSSQVPFRNGTDMVKVQRARYLFK